MKHVPDFIYLASQSPRRRQLLEQIGVRYELLLPRRRRRRRSAGGRAARRTAGRLRAARDARQAARGAREAGGYRSCRIGADPVLRHHRVAGPADPRQADRCGACDRDAGRTVRPHAPRDHRRGGRRGPARVARGEHLARPLRRDSGARDRALRGRRRALRQGRCLRDPERHRGLDQPASTEATPVSWVCLSSRRHSSSGRPACGSDPQPGSTASCKTS